MIRLLHLADVHLGKTFRMLGQRGSAQRRAIKGAFERAVGVALERKVHLVLIAGDLFDNPRPSDSLVEFVGTQLRQLDGAGIPTILLAGNHDVGEDGYVGPAVKLRELTSGLYLIGPENEVHMFSELDLTVLARSAVPGQTTSPLAGWPKERRTRFAVGVTHGATYRGGQVEGPHVIHPNEIRDLGLDYLALGDWHSAFEITPPPASAWYSGAPEWLDFNQTRTGHVLLVEIPAPGQANVTPLAIGKRRSVRQEFNAAETDEAGLRAAIAAAADLELVYEAVLTGLMPLHRAINVEVVGQDLAPRFFRLRVTNHSRIWLDEDSLGAIPIQTMLGRFVRLMWDRIAQAPADDRRVLEEALQVGAAVLTGRGDEVLV